MSLRHIDFLLQETFTGIRRNLFMSLAAVSSIAAAMLLLGALRLVLGNLDRAAEAVGSRFEMRAYLAASVSPEHRDRLARQIASMRGIESCRLVTKEQALPELCARLSGTVTLSDLGPENPLPDAFVVRVHDPAKMGALADRVRKLPGVDEVVDTREAAQVWAAVTRGVKRGGLVAVGLLLLAAAIIVSSTIQLTVHSRRLEIGIMQLVGATPGCVRTPFLLEGALQGLAGALVAVALLSAGYSYLYSQLGDVRQVVSFLDLVPPARALLWSQAGPLTAIGVALGLASSYLATRRHLKA